MNEGHSVRGEDIYSGLYESAQKSWDEKLYNYSIQLCWRKAYILPFTLNAEIDISVGRTLPPQKIKIVSKEMCDELCCLMADVKLKATEYSINTGSAVGAVFSEQFVVKRDLTDTEMKTMAETWIGIEDNKEVVDDIFD